MTLRGMEIVLTVADTLSMRQAAEQLFISQPSVSGAVSEIEKELGILLFERFNKRLYITEAGLEFCAYARRMVELDQEMRMRLAQTGQNIKLRIGATITVGSCMIVDIVTLMPAPAPYVLINNTPEIEHKLMVNKLDIALVEGAIGSPELVVEPVFQDELVLACSEALLEKETSGWKSCDEIQLSDLAGKDLLLREEGSRARELFMGELHKAKVGVNILWESSNTDALLQAIQKGIGFGVVSNRIIDEGSGIRTFHIADADMVRNFSLVYHKNKYLNPALKTFMALCRAYEPHRC